MFDLKLLEEIQKFNLNLDLIKEKNLNETDILNMLKLYKEIENIFKIEEGLIKDFNKKTEEEQEKIKKELKSFDKRIKEIEFELQKLWRFDQKEFYHKYWFLQPACSCPKMDNYDNLGFDRRIINCECLIHGDECKD
jgi:tRNA U55 pseudouridine synthase TruB